MKTVVPVAAAALALAACSPDFDPASRIEKLRVLAVRADPPEIAPAPAAGATATAPDRAALTSLVLRADFASDPARATTLVYVACLPVPGDPTPTPCVALASLRDPTAALADAARAACDDASPGAAPPPIAFAGAERCEGGTCGPVTLPGGAVLPTPAIALPAGYGFEALPAGAPDRILGVEAVALAFALDADPGELGQGADVGCPLAGVAARLSELWAPREHVLAVKRVRIRGPEAPDAPNQNPVLAGVAVDGAPLVDGSPALRAGKRRLTPALPDGADALREPYTRLDAAGAPIESAREEWVYSWFSTAGEMKDLRTRDPDPAEEWTLGPADAGAGGTRALVAAVVRDLRGGEAWAVREVTVER